MTDKKITEARIMLCHYLASLAKARNMTTTELAEKTGFKQPNVSRMLSGKYPPTLDNFIRLADALDAYIFVIDKDADSDLVKMMKKRWKRPNDEG